MATLHNQATWRVVIQDGSDHAEFIVETTDFVLSLVMTKEILWHLAKSAMDAADLINMNNEQE